MTNLRASLILGAIAALLFGAFALVARAGADEIAEPTPDWAAGPDAEAPTKTAPGVAAEVEPGSNDDLIAKFEAVRDAYKDRDADGKLVVYLAGIMAAAAWFLMAVLARWRRLTEYGKQWIPKVVAGLAVFAGGAASLAAGLPWWQALVVGAGPALSVFIHELFKSGKDPVG